MSRDAGAGAGAGADAGPVARTVMATLDRLVAVEPRTRDIRAALVDAAVRADTDPVVREALRTAVGTLTDAIGTVTSVDALAEELPVPDTRGSATPDPDTRGSATPDPTARDAVVALALVIALPATVAWYRTRGVPEDVAWASVADAPRKLAVYGLHGTGVDWLSAVVAGRVLAVGRLQFEWGGRVSEDAAAACDVPVGAPAWGVHVPETGPLDPAACDDAFDRAPALLEALTGTRAAVWTCESWLLDPRVADLLGPDANTVRFARRFTLLSAVAPGPSSDADADAEHDAEADAAIAKFVFGAASLQEARRRPVVGRLQQGVLAHLDAGGHWYERDGVARVVPASV